MAAEHTRVRIANVLVQMRHDRVVEMGATPKTDAEKLNARIARLERELRISQSYVKVQDARIEKLETENLEWKKRYDVALELLHVKQKNIVSQADYDAKLEAVGLEKLPDVDAEALRQEIEQHIKKGK